MKKDNVVIEEGGMRYVVGATGSRGCDDCKSEDKCSSLLKLVCEHPGHSDFRKIVSATKITPQPRIYHAWDREEARGLIGSVVEVYNGKVGSEWRKDILVDLDSRQGEYPFELSYHRGDMIREIPQIKMTWEEAKAKYGIGDEVVIVEGE